MTIWTRVIWAARLIIQTMSANGGTTVDILTMKWRVVSFSRWFWHNQLRNFDWFWLGNIFLFCGIRCNTDFQWDWHILNIPKPNRHSKHTYRSIHLNKSYLHCSALLRAFVTSWANMWFSDTVGYVCNIVGCMLNNFSRMTWAYFDWGIWIYKDIQWCLNLWESNLWDFWRIFFACQRESLTYRTSTYETFFGIFLTILVS